MKSMREKTACKATAGLVVVVIGVGLLAPLLDEPVISDTALQFCLPFCVLDSKGLEPTNQFELCSVLTASCGDKILFGGNVDSQPLEHFGNAPYIFVFSPSEKDYGIGAGYGFVAIGRTWKEDGIRHEHLSCGMNEKGLAFGTNGLPEVPMNPHPERPYPGSSMPFRIKAMRECSSVDSVIEMAKTFDWSTTSMRQQYHFADSTGDAMVISAGEDGELAFTRKNETNYLVSTNFNRANPKNGKYPCWRYDTAVEMLEEMENEDDLTVHYFESVLDAIHQESKSVNTAYSYIFDLRTGDGYVYYFHQFDEVVEFNVSVELAESGEGSVSFYSFDYLFSQETQNKAVYELWKHQKWIILLKIAFGVAALLGLCFFGYRKVRNYKSE